MEKTFAYGIKGFTGNQIGQLSEILGVSVAVLYGLHEEKKEGIF